MKVKLKFKKWWMYLVPSMRRWLKECEAHMNTIANAGTDPAIVDKLVRDGFAVRFDPNKSTKVT